jgi:hypothetical protein
MTRPFAFALLLVVAVAVSPGVCRAAPILFVTGLSGPAEAPPNNSPGIGVAIVTFDTAAHTMRVQVTFSGLIGTTTAAHIHAPTALPLTGTAGVATELPSFTGFPLGVTSGTYDHTFNTALASFYNPAFLAANGGSVANAEAALFQFMSEGRAYLNVHTTFRPGGEIRGFFTPEPSSLAVLGACVLGGAIVGRRRKAARPA